MVYYRVRPENFDEGRPLIVTDLVPGNATGNGLVNSRLNRYRFLGPKSFIVSMRYTVYRYTVMQN